MNFTKNSLNPLPVRYRRPAMLSLAHVFKRMGGNTMGHYDRTMKLLVDADPRGMARFILRQGQHLWGNAFAEARLASATQLNPEFPADHIQADGLILATNEDESRYLIGVEHQRRRHPYMPLRQLHYCVRAKVKNMETLGDIPIIAAVIHLFDDGNIQEPPYCWPLIPGQRAPTLEFRYLSIKLWELEREEVLGLGNPALWPLALLTKGPVDRILVKEMFEALLDHQLYDLLPIGQTVAGWLLKSVDLEWLQREYQQMLEFFEDSPAYQWMVKGAQEKGLKQGLEQGRAQGLEQGRLLEARQNIEAVVQTRFPALLELTKSRVEQMTDLAKLQETLLTVSTAHTARAVKAFLLTL